MKVKNKEIQTEVVEQYVQTEDTTQGVWLVSNLCLTLSIDKVKGGTTHCFFTTAGLEVEDQEVQTEVVETVEQYVQAEDTTQGVWLVSNLCLTLSIDKVKGGTTHCFFTTAGLEVEDQEVQTEVVETVEQYVQAEDTTQGVWLVSMTCVRPMRCIDVWKLTMDPPFKWKSKFTYLKLTNDFLIWYFCHH